jgi:hypothetical protein
MFRFLTLLLLLAGSLAANTFTASTHSQGGSSCSHVDFPDPTSCDSGSGGPGFVGQATASAGFGLNSMAFAIITVYAECHFGNDCHNQGGTADVELDLAIHGLAGEPGLVEIAHLNVGNVIVSADTAVTGLTVFAPFPGPHSGTVYNFIYEQSFHVSAIAHGGCSECGDSQFPFRGSARVISPFYVYDLNMNLRETIISPLDAQAAPEPKPGSLALSAGLLFMAWRKFSS